MASTAVAPHSPSVSALDLSHQNELSRNTRPPSPPLSSARDLATREEVQRREMATLVKLVIAVSSEIPRSLGVAGVSAFFAWAGQKTVLTLMKNHPKAKTVLVIGGGVGDAASGVGKEFTRAFLANCFPTLKVPNHVQTNRLWPLTKNAAEALLHNGVAEGLFHFLAGLANSFGISKEMSYYGMDHIPDKSEAYLEILNHINPKEILSPLAVKVGSEFLKDIVIVLGVAVAFKRFNPEFDFQMCRKFNMRKITNTALLNSAARVVVAVCSAAWVNSNQNTSQTAFMFTGARNASLPAVFNFLRVVFMGIMLAAFANKFSTRNAPIDLENRVEGINGNDGHDLSFLPNRERPALEEPRVIELDDESNPHEQSRAGDSMNEQGSDNSITATIDNTVAASSQAQDVLETRAADTSMDSSSVKSELASSAKLSAGQGAIADPASDSITVAQESSSSRSVNPPQDEALTAQPKEEEQILSSTESESSRSTAETA